MATEIERKFLLKNDNWRTVKGTRYRQGYLCSTQEKTVRIRTMDDRAYLTIKGASIGASRMEFEYEIPTQDAEELLNTLCRKPLIEKNRHKVEHAGHIWEIDEFFGDNQGLIVAEIELNSEDQAFEKPDWVDEEVTHDPRYFNANLNEHPFSQW